MRVLTKPYGTIDVDERQRILFPFGILGFEKMKEYVLLDALQQPFYWLQSLEVPEIAFVLINPIIFRPDYTPDVPDVDLEEIGIETTEDLLCFSIVTIPEVQTQMTANLQGPLLINKKKKVGRQSISTNPKWNVRHRILEELAAIRNEAC